MELYPDCYIENLPNGLRIIGQEIARTKSISLGLWFNCGSRDELPDRQGVTHLIEHLIFRGTSNRSAYEITSTVDKLGGKINGGTGREYLVIYLNLLPEGLDRAVELIADLAKNPLFDSRALRIEKGVITEEIRSSRDNHQGEVMRLLREAIWGKESNLSERVAGKEDTIKRLNREHVMDRFESLRSGPNLVLSAAGQLDYEELLDLARDHLKSINGDERPKSPADRPLEGEEKVRVLNRDLNQTHLSIGVEGLEKGNDKRYALEMLNVILGNGMSSRLFRKIRKKKGLVYQITTNTEYLSDTGSFLIYGATDKNNLTQVVGLIEEEIRKIKNEPVSDKELKLAKAKTKGNTVLGLESNQANMIRLGNSQIYDIELNSLNQVLQKIDSVSKEDILEVAEDILQEDRFRGSLLGTDVESVEPEKVLPGS